MYVYIHHTKKFVDTNYFVMVVFLTKFLVSTKKLVKIFSVTKKLVKIL